MRPVILVACMLLSQFASGQLSGIIRDDRIQKSIVGADVFIHGRSVFTVTDDEGKFQLDGISPGFADLVIHKKGYTLYKSSIRIDPEKRYEVNLTLQRSPKQSGSPAPPEETGLFKETLSGVNDLNLVNTSALTFVRNGAGKRLTAADPLILINRGLGYRISYYLNQAIWTGSKYDVKGYYTFEPISFGRSEEIIEVAQRRVDAYSGSVRHLLKSLVAGTAESEGFTVSPPIAVKASIANYYILTGEKTTSVSYKGMLSQLTMDESLQVSEDGILLIPNTLAVTGPMAGKSKDLILPQDYVPVIPGADDLMQYYEKIYVQTDKPYYYPGEPLWFKGYINYYEPSWRDSLSKVAYVELIDPSKKVILSKALRIDSGLFHSDFILPDSLTAGGYYLRAYTQLSRNYGDDRLFVKSLPVLSMVDRLNRSQSVNDTVSNPHLIVHPDKKRYSTREKISLSMGVRGSVPLRGNISVSVTDVAQVIDVPTHNTILDRYRIEHGQLLPHIVMKYPVEFGVSYSGRFLNDRGKPVKTNLTIIQHRPRKALFATTDDLGNFQLTGLQFSDTTTFSFKSDQATSYPFGKVEILPAEAVPAINFPETTQIEIEHTGEAQRLISEYEVPKDTKMLEAVTIKASRVEQEVKPIRMYGAGDYSIPENGVKVGYPNLLYTLVGYPGLYVSPGQGIVKFVRSMNQSVLNAKSPLVVVNDVPMQGDAGEVLRLLDPANVSSIEVFRRIKPIFGSEGAFGVISVYTKNGLSGTNNSITPNFQQMKLHGFSNSRVFKSPDYSNPPIGTIQPDYRATLYWNPDINISSDVATVSFFSSDLPGIYRITIEGILSNGEPVRVVQFIEVEDR
ncbi:MAG TPA: carboxypeptidase-like regulatory domain-containing protein [Cyclobacteriaceae bacterium]|nr:carboxypeptidase-like regulatory domain-containing protein [Cyclobacteriaceae bacterium]